MANKPPTRYRCNACGGTYFDKDAAGTTYFHACAPLSDAEVADALGVPADPNKQTDDHRAQLAAAPRARPNARDENVHATSGPDAAKMRAVGAGRTKV